MAIGTLYLYFYRGVPLGSVTSSSSLASRYSLALPLPILFCSCLSCVIILQSFIPQRGSSPFHYIRKCLPFLSSSFCFALISCYYSSCLSQNLPFTSLKTPVSARSFSGNLCSCAHFLGIVMPLTSLLPPRHFETFYGHHQAFCTFHTWPESQNPFIPLLFSDCSAELRYRRSNLL